MRLLVLAVLPQVALAESSWITARGRLLPETRLEAFVGTRSAGVGFLRTDDANARAGFAVEALVGYSDRDLEVRGGRVYQLTERRFATASVSVGGAAFVVPDRRVTDFGLGPHAQLSLTLGGDVFAVDLSVQSGVELFARGGLRLPQRAGLGLHLKLSEFTVAVMSRIGADLMPGHSFVGRGEVIFTVGWLGLDSQLSRTR